MKSKRIFVGTAIALLIATAASTPIQNLDAANTEVTTTTVKADTTTTYTSSEEQAIKAYQQQYASLSGDSDTIANLYDTNPVFSDTFNPGVLKTSVIDQTINWINYYRNLSGLPDIAGNLDSDTLAQISSAVMASAGSNPFKNQHGLVNTTKPTNIPDIYWNRAVLGTDSSDLYFGYPTTIGEPIKELILDNTNISGLDVGHRAWLLSPYLSTVGVGIATSPANGRQYESILVRNTPDANRTPALNVVSYPGNGVYPIEALVASTGSTAIPWSVAFAQNENLVSDNTTITVTNLTDGTTGTVSPSYYGSEGFSKTVVSFLPPTNVTMNDHSQYQITVNDLNSETIPSYSYTFKTFSENGSGISGQTSDKTNSNNTDAVNSN